MMDLYLDEYAQAILNEAASHARIIAYTGRTDWLGKTPRYVRYIKGHLSDSLEKHSRPVTIINGGYRDNLSIELWIVPDGVSAPTPSESTFEIRPKEQGPYKFDETEALIMEYNKKSYLSFGLLCTLPYPEWGQFFRVLRDEPNLRGHIITYVGHKDSPHYAKRIEKFLRDDLGKDYPNEVKQLTMAYGGKREWSRIEIWIALKGEPNPKPTPRERRARVHRDGV
jgi:hypothetical protein